MDKSAGCLRPDIPIICFSHLRWDFVFQRPQHLMSRFARTRRVFFVQEVELHDGAAILDTRHDPATGVTVWIPRLPREGNESDRDATVEALLLGAMEKAGFSRPVLWYYTPLMRAFSSGIAASAIVYDCMDELSQFRFAPAALVDAEKELMRVADVMFTGGYSLYEAKRRFHPNIHPFPSAVDREHFAKARQESDPADQSALPHPRLGYFGVIDERIDLELVAKIAGDRPGWSIVMLGPAAKLGPEELPRRANIHYLGMKPYAELPNYLSGWDVALMPFAINKATQFISPTKTPEYLSGGKMVVSTPIADVQRHYGDLNAVCIAATADAFVAACDTALALSREPEQWLPAADAALAGMSWDATFLQMEALVDAAVTARNFKPAPRVHAHYDFLVVGAGFAGSVMAERLASSGSSVLVVDRRSHIGGNAYDYHDASGVLVHKYGPHIFHTNSEEIFAYLSQFTSWRPYEHRVLADIGAKRVPIPINRTTLNEVFGIALATDEDVKQFLNARAERIAVIRTSEDVVLSTVGRELYEMFFQDYTRKQWGLDPSELDKSVTARIPTRFNTDDRYFTDRFQAMPALGYTEMFERMLSHPNITVVLDTDFRDIARDVDFGHLIYTGSIDEYYGFSEGKLPYRSLTFEHRSLKREKFQPVGTVNYPSIDKMYTRITEFKHMTGQASDSTSIVFELPSDDGDPYYPIPTAENAALYKRYEALAMREENVTFVGRLATYRYYNMDQVVGQALATFRRLRAASKSFRASSIAAAE